MDAAEAVEAAHELLGNDSARAMRIAALALDAVALLAACSEPDQKVSPSPASTDTAPVHPLSCWLTEERQDRLADTVTTLAMEHPHEWPSCGHRIESARIPGAMYFFVRTQNPRPTFHLDMSADERSTMTEHVAYWTEKADEGKAIVFGPVLDPAGAFGMGVYEVADEFEMRHLLDDDPAKGLLKYELFPMPRAVVGKLSP